MNLKEFVEQVKKEAHTVKPAQDRPATPTVINLEGNLMAVVFSYHIEAQGLVAQISFSNPLSNKPPDNELVTLLINTFFHPEDKLEESLPQKRLEDPQHIKRSLELTQKIVPEATEEVVRSTVPRVRMFTCVNPKNTSIPEWAQEK
jgi:hypothetical protein